MNSEGMTTRGVASYSHTVDQIMEDMKNLIPETELPTKRTSDKDVKEAVKKIFMNHKKGNSDTGIKYRHLGRRSAHKI
jgi:hypothetical protein